MNTWRGAGRYWAVEGWDILSETLTLPTLVPTPRVAEVLRLHPTTVLRLCAAGELPRVTVNHHERYIRRDDLVSFILRRAYADAGLALLEALLADAA
ncbi:helix-turn-helix domain-containing protein [Mycobacteroides abscessus]|uniref:helix-turn-helix domain-containing protein n=1 Tax=Mycobacteroides abscessus TaxID=36809 RepID=UPI001F3396CF|nr:helix-turn-helix domain-containing protein [Mycobacteroides abscessus]